jgi:hypothetical protein
MVLILSCRLNIFEYESTLVWLVVIGMDTRIDGLFSATLAVLLFVMRLLISINTCWIVKKLTQRLDVIDRPVLLYVCPSTNPNSSKHVLDDLSENMFVACVNVYLLVAVLYVIENPAIIVMRYAISVLTL